MTEQTLWLSVLHRAVLDAKLSDEARAWLLDDKYAAERESICDLAGVGTYELRKYVIRNGIAEGFAPEDLRALNPEPQVELRWCHNCGEPYEPNRVNQKFCGKACKIDAQNRRRPQAKTS